MNDQTQYEVLERMAILMDGNEGMTYEIALKQAYAEIQARDKKPEVKSGPVMILPNHTSGRPIKKKPDDDFSFLGG
jgi:hypothetical protein